MGTSQFIVSIGLAVRPHGNQITFPEVLELADLCIFACTTPKRIYEIHLIRERQSQPDKMAICGNRLIAKN